MTIAKRQQRNYIPGIAKLLTMEGYTAVMTYEIVPSGLQNSGQVKWKLHNCQDTTKVVVNLLQLNGERYMSHYFSADQPGDKIYKQTKPFDPIQIHTDRNL